MQTFLPFPDFQQSAAVLDRVRLGKQRVEALQILRALVIPEYGWQSHPAVRMWMGYVPALTMYGLAMVDEWTARGGEDTTREKIMEFAPQAAHPDYAAKIPMPPWLGNAGFPPQPPVPADRQGSAVLHRGFPGHGPGPGVRLARTEARAGARGSCRGPHVGPAPAARRHRARAAEDRQPAAGWPQQGRPRDDDYQFVYADSGSRRPGKVRKLPPKQLVKKPTRKRQQQEEAFTTLPGNSVVAIPVNGGSSFAVGKVLGRPITVDGQFARNFQVDEIVDRSAFDYPALMQDPRAFFPIPAR